MLLLSDLSPSKLGLGWGRSSEACLAALSATVLEHGAGFVLLEADLNGERYRVALLFEDDRLWRLEVDLYESRSFWNDYIVADVEQSHAKSMELFQGYVRFNSARLGEPAYIGRRGSIGYPEDQTAEHAAYWVGSDARFQIEQDQPDKEFPFCVRAAVYEPGSKQE